MRIERSHVPWALISLALVLGGGYVYRGYAASALNGPSGSTAIGLTFGIIAAVCMYFTGALSLRKRFRSWRLGSARTWLKGHLWLGFVALPLIWMHAGNFGIEHGGMLTRVIMVLMYIVWITGVYGILL